jgi:hypothetical protein
MDNNEALTRIADKLNVIATEQGDQGNRLTRIEADVAHHVKRSDKLEDIVTQHQKYFWMTVGLVVLGGPVLQFILSHHIK